MGQKLSQVHKTPKLAQLSTPRRTQACPGARMPGLVVGAMAVSWPWPPAVSQAQGTVSQRTGAISWPSVARASRCVVAMSRYSPQPSPCFPGHNTLKCIMTQSLPPQPTCLPCHNTDYCIVTPFSLPSGHNTPRCIAIQLSHTSLPLLYITIQFQPSPGHQTLLCHDTLTVS